MTFGCTETAFEESPMQIEAAERSMYIMPKENSFKMLASTIQEIVGGIKKAASYKSQRLEGLFSRSCCMGNRAYGKTEAKLPEYFQERTEVWCGFPGFNSCYGRMWESAQFSEVSLGEIQMMALFNHCADNLGKCLNSVDIPTGFYSRCFLSSAPSSALR